MQENREQDFAFQNQKLNLIERLMSIREQAVLNRYTALLEKAELQARTEESVNAIKNGEVVDLSTFESNSKEWLKQNATK